MVVVVAVAVVADLAVIVPDILLLGLFQGCLVILLHIVSHFD